MSENKKLGCARLGCFGMIGLVVLSFALSPFIQDPEDAEPEVTATGTEPEADTEAGMVIVTMESGPAAKLAALDHGGNEIPEELLDRYRAILDRVTGKCTEDRQGVADITVRASELLVDEGIDRSLLEILQNFDTAIPQEAAGIVSCQETAAILITAETG